MHCHYLCIEDLSKKKNPSSIGKIEYAHKKFTQGLKNPLNPSDTQDTYGEYYLNKQTDSNGFPSDIFAVCTTGKCDCQ